MLSHSVVSLFATPGSSSVHWSFQARILEWVASFNMILRMSKLLADSNLRRQC